MKKNLLLKLVPVVFTLVSLIIITENIATAGWTSMSSGVTDTLYGVWGSSGTDVFTVGSNGTILRYNGTGWSFMGSGTTNYLGSSCRSVGDFISL